MSTTNNCSLFADNCSLPLEILGFAAETEIVVFVFFVVEAAIAGGNTSWPLTSEVGAFPNP